MLKTALMKSWTTFGLVLLLALVVGCSKQTSSGEPKVVELGVVELTFGTPSRHELGDGAVCVLTADPMGPGDIELIGTLEKRRGDPEVSRVIPARVNQPTELSFTGFTVTLTPRITR
jgi:hypothetical protein